MMTTADRLKELMDVRKLKQIDILQMVAPYCEKYMIKMNKSDISQYVSGKVKPGQSKLSILGLALNVSEGWLMGLPVPMERADAEEPAVIENEKEPTVKNHSELSENDRVILDLIQSIPSGKKMEAIRYLRYLAESKDSE